MEKASGPLVPAPTAVILAGGRSRRFGADKAWIEVRGKPLIQGVIERLREAGFAPVLSVGCAHSFLSLKVPIVEDALPCEGPLCALHRVLELKVAERFLLVAVDMPILIPSILQLLWNTPDADVVWLEDERHDYPLPGVYARSIFPAVSRLLDQGQRDLKSLGTSGLVVRKIARKRWRSLDPDGHTLMNINTPSDLRGFRQKIT